MKINLEFLVLMIKDANIVKISRKMYTLKNIQGKFQIFLLLQM